MFIVATSETRFGVHPAPVVQYVAHIEPENGVPIEIELPNIELSGIITGTCAPLTRFVYVIDVGAFASYEVPVLAESAHASHVVPESCPKLNASCEFELVNTGDWQ